MIDRETVNTAIERHGKPVSLRPGVGPGHAGIRSVSRTIAVRYHSRCSNLGGHRPEPTRFSGCFAVVKAVLFFVVQHSAKSGAYRPALLGSRLRLRQVLISVGSPGAS